MKNPKPWVMAVIVATVMSVTSSASAYSTFSDVPNSHWAYQAINGLAARALVNGYPDGDFAGQRFLTRYEFAAAVQRLTEEPGRLDFPRFKPFSRPKAYLPAPSSRFPDVPREHWAA